MAFFKIVLHLLLLSMIKYLFQAHIKIALIICCCDKLEKVNAIEPTPA